MNTFAQALATALSYAVVSRDLDDSTAVGFAYREAPAFEHDSGWRFFSGGESDEFCDDAANFDTLPVQEVASAHPEIAALLNESEGAWEWCDHTQAFVAAADWQPQD